ncbi:MAG: M1 family metallopeptidase, partial [Vicinamibacterales bacterium]|nr:M1 family metallopeptidase [Vicinamibacterales bacterium]
MLRDMIRYPLLLLLPLLFVGFGSAPVSADIFPRQPGIDVEHYVFRIGLSDATDEISGEATVRIRFRTDGLTEVALDLASVSAGTGMTVTAVMAIEAMPLGGQALAFVHQDDRLRVTLPTPSRAGELGGFTVVYQGEPAAGLSIGSNKHGERSFFSNNWPHRARQWLPTVDHPYDKATSEFIVTAPSHYQVVSNGRLQETLDLPGDLRRTHWKQSVPIASWLNALGAARFAVHHAGEVAGVPLQTWVFRQDRDAGIRDFEPPARQVMEFFSEQIGPYPYEKLANVQAADLGGGMELASAIFYGENSVKGEGRLTGLVAHEIAHQWFGDSVTEDDWDDVWLSEGFATYFALLFTEHAFGRDRFVAGLERSRDAVIRFDASNPDYRVVHDELSDMADVLSRQIYQKGGWTLHMLRGVLGTDEFWSGIREYYRRYRDTNASTDDFRRVMEEVGGQDLGWFFEQWLYRGGVPRVDGSWRYDADGGRVEIELRQTQSGDSFRLPLTVGLSVDGQAERRVERIELRERTGRFTIAVDGEPPSVVLDPDVWVLMDATFER